MLAYLSGFILSLAASFAIVYGGYRVASAAISLLLQKCAPPKPCRSCEHYYAPQPRTKDAL